MTILLAIDSFKGSLSSVEVEECVASALQGRPEVDEVVSIPLSDGGEGMLEAWVKALGGRRLQAEVCDPLMRPIMAEYGIGHNQTAVIEMAKASGLELLHPHERNPLLTTTYGLGQLIVHALDQEIRHFIVGIGGSATNDAGLGMLQALGARLTDGSGHRVPACGGNLPQIAHIDTSAMHPALAEASFTIACDVRNPFCGPEGASRVFAPQKGANPAQVEQLEVGMSHIANLVRQQTHIDLNTTPGAGAAGGIGGAFLAFLGAKLRSGIDSLTEVAHIERHIQCADLIITGEGRADRQTLMGKAPLGILRLAQKYAKPVALLAGRVDDPDLLRQAGFDHIIEVSPRSLPTEQAMLPDVTRTNIALSIDRLTTICL